MRGLKGVLPTTIAMDCFIAVNYYKNNVKYLKISNKIEKSNNILKRAVRQKQGFFDINMSFLRKSYNILKMLQKC